MTDNRDWMEIEGKRDEAVRIAVATADRIILAASDGTVECTDYLTCRVAHEFGNKVLMAVGSALRRREFMNKK